MPRVCSLIHVESTSRSLSHPLQLQFLQARLMAVEKVVEGGAQGPLYLWGNDQSLLCVETLRAFAEEERIRWMWNLELTVPLQLSLKNALGQP